MGWKDMLSMQKLALTTLLYVDIVIHCQCLFRDMFKWNKIYPEQTFHNLNEDIIEFFY
jgi:hypothetical protein